MSNNINGGGRGRNAMSSVDFYRRVPKDLTEVRWKWQKPCLNLFEVLGQMLLDWLVGIVSLQSLTIRTKSVVCRLKPTIGVTANEV